MRLRFTIFTIFTSRDLPRLALANARGGDGRGMVGELRLNA
jgi:hypothetical protein